MTHAPFLAIGLMSGTSMDGVDAVLMRFDAQALSLLAQTNDIAQIIADTPEGEMLPGTTITQEDAALRAQLLGEFMAWANQTSEGAPMSRLAIFFRRF